MAPVRQNLSQRTAQELKELILSQKKYKENEKLPNENELSKELGVSRTTLREAIRILVSDGLLIVQRGRGTFVAGALDHYAHADIPEKERRDIKVTLRDLYEARMLIEPEAASLAAKRATDEEIEKIISLGNVVQECIQKDPRGSDRIDSEINFHGALLRASHNEFLAQFIPLLMETIEKTFILNENLEIVAEDAYKDHILIMNFLKKRDAQGLKSAIQIHLHHAAWNENLEMY